MQGSSLWRHSVEENSLSKFLTVFKGGAAWVENPINRATRGNKIFFFKGKSCYFGFIFKLFIECNIVIIINYI